MVALMLCRCVARKVATIEGGLFFRLDIDKRYFAEMYFLDRWT